MSLVDSLHVQGWTSGAHMLLQHSVACREDACGFAGCCGLRQLLRHAECCMAAPRASCTRCASLMVLVTLHARDCRQRDCTVIGCSSVKAGLMAKREE
jgi:hypothetical protein